MTTRCHLHVVDPRLSSQKKRSINVADGGATISYVLTGVVVNKYFTT